MLEILQTSILYILRWLFSKVRNVTHDMTRAQTHTRKVKKRKRRNYSRTYSPGGRQVGRAELLKCWTDTVDASIVDT